MIIATRVGLNIFISLRESRFTAPKKTIDINNMNIIKSNSKLGAKMIEPALIPEHYVSILLK